MNRNGEGLGCLSGILAFCFMGGNVFLFTGALNDDLSDNPFAWIMVLIAIVADIIAIGYIISVIAKHNEKKRLDKTKNQASQVLLEIKKQIDEINSFERYIRDCFNNIKFESDLIKLLESADENGGNILSRSFYNCQNSIYNIQRRALISKDKSLYISNLPTELQNLNNYMESIGNKKQKLKRTVEMIDPEKIGPEQMQNYYKEFCRQEYNSKHKERLKKQIIIGSSLFVLTLGITALGIFKSAGLASYMAKRCYEEQLNEKFSQCVLSDTIVKNVGYSEFYKSDKYIHYMCGDIVCYSESIQDLGDNNEELLQAVRQLYSKINYNMTYEHDNGYEIKFDHGSWYSYSIIIKDGEGNTYKYGREDTWSDYVFTINDKILEEKEN